jgi:hypothetical protein
MDVGQLADGPTTYEQEAHLHAPEPNSTKS